jgi:5-formyltetrahydrofolate cyclo-ligase
MMQDPASKAPVSNFGKYIDPQLSLMLHVTMTIDPRIPCTDSALPAPTAQKTTMNDSMDKAVLRKQLLARRAQIAAVDKAGFDAIIGERVLAWVAHNGIEQIGVYWPLRGEPALAAAYQALAGRGVQLLLPVVVARDAALGFTEWQPGEALVKDQMGVAVPAILRMAGRPQALLIPCLGFNAERFRLGYGGGYYDRTLEKTPRPLTAGVAYACLLADFASAPHDVALDLVITEA